MNRQHRTQVFGLQRKERINSMNIEDEINSNEPVDDANICMIIVEYYKNVHIISHPKIKEKNKKLYSVKKIKPNFRSFRIKHFHTNSNFHNAFVLFLVVNSHYFH